MAQDHILIAKNSNWGVITREFKQALIAFTSTTENELGQMRDNVQYGFMGSDNVFTEIRNSMNDRLNRIDQDVQNLKELIPKLEEKAQGYDKIISELVASIKANKA